MDAINVFQSSPDSFAAAMHYITRKNTTPRGYAD
jgi:hypothetical protein